MVETLRLGRASGYIRPGIDLETLADRLCQVLLHISLGVFPGVRGAERAPGDPVPDPARRRRRPAADGRGARPVVPRSLAAQQLVDAWDKAEDEEDERLPMLRAVARAEFGRKGYEATTVRDIANGRRAQHRQRLPPDRVEGRAARRRSCGRSRRRSSRGWSERARVRRDGRREARRADVDQHQRRRPVQRRVQHPARLDPGVAADQGQPRAARSRRGCATSSRCSPTAPGPARSASRPPPADIRAWAMFELSGRMPEPSSARSAPGRPRPRPRHVLRGAARRP